MLPTVMFVCTGNTCRSPVAERLAALLDPDTRFVSTGTYAIFPSIDADMAAQLRRLGGDDTGFSGTQLSAANAAAADLIVALTREHRRFIVESLPGAAERTVMLKPYARAVAAGQATAWNPPADLAAGVNGDSSDDVADPYRLGWNEAERAADEIHDALRTILRL
ncbi:low molecular weight phosphatase family protein [Brevibacterium sp. 50QC2O2]|jgi:protein-tyrosine phosphatase|uniref:arsenate reductase/protein-tyrosine-phosphatase family protein n=1 Tax=Brevibacterium TaxID=1696 RepID=UPI00211CAED9|nr:MULTISPECIES: low molecular weight phosphatase family protein [unclassified Brevibacterium]MCQ9368057.1 low molecular weight phosphatase family protein [Brevibacterium sp. 91QC2O2]MCQ9385259.1 low molecular weight phosphatase family protein [Brevibacterium sp. 68QC2CO]MCQ9388765.1 low molecular weight phosphatase family protein [Brevibacterium sp. 50QC2O2]